VPLSPGQPRPHAQLRNSGLTRLLRGPARHVVAAAMPTVAAIVVGSIMVRSRLAAQTRTPSAGHPLAQEQDGTTRALAADRDVRSNQSTLGSRCARWCS
jgi:hypothetical protein